MSCLASATSVLELDGVYSILQVTLGLSLLLFLSLMELRAYLRSSSSLLTLSLSLMAFIAAVLQLDGVYSSLKATLGPSLPYLLELDGGYTRHEVMHSLYLCPGA
jgi:hypothetical protein